MTPTEYANKHLFEPLGIAPRKNFYATNAQEHIHFTIDNAPKEKIPAHKWEQK